MTRERISTTVDGAVLAEARRRTGNRDSELFDAALAALLDRLDTDAELRALDALPYDDDPELAMPSSADATGPAIWVGDYEGDVPAAVVALARQRRAARRAAG